ncbi:MAG: DUF932 domain-containing protein [Deltaproteobacteria bacterium]|nr:DUF932 domain-containing protein [Deltaproteobacteria bacterium]
MSGTLITHRGAVRIPKEELMQIQPPAPTDTWKPVAHGVLVNTLTEVLFNRGIVVKKEEYAIQRDGNLLFGVMDLAWGGTMDYYAALGLRTSNDKTLAIQIAIGARVIICDNLLMSGELIALKRKHTAGLDLVEELNAGVRRYELGYQQLGKGIERMKQCKISLTEVRELIFNVFARKILPIRLFSHIAGNYANNADWPKLISLWDVHNVFTFMLKKLKPSVAFEANVRLGKFFELGEPRLPRGEQLVNPTDVGYSLSQREEGFQAREVA